MTDCRLERTLAGICLLMLCVTLSWMQLLEMPPALAGINDDNFDGNIFALYGGNGSLIPPKVTLAQALKRDKPILLVFYVDDSRDCKQYSTVVSQLQAFYGVPADFIPIDVDAILPKSTYEPTEPGYYYEGLVPQTLILDETGKVVFNASGNIPFERVDDAFREVFDLLPRSESVELRRRPVNEINVELTQ
ncbi:MAG: thylakoid membrane photosystem I accumulation factor [Hormoscilla sp. SP5CHS1]|nr:thylakoid membrane photosystem I accumulation factor [Hormoscilla sp. SP12CHS1]MBC6451877.1 thylakoid membrane photosystem I accumulation factor [Hormoscilla sp. SP5CHS1]